jgi:hypothetical protein
MANNIITVGGHKKLGPNALKQVSDHFFVRRFFTLDAGVGIEEVFKPAFWSNHKLNDHDLIRVRAHDGSFDFELTVISSQQGGAVVDFFPRFPPEYEDPNSIDAVRQKVVPFVNGKPAIRVDFSPGTLYRVIGLDGSTIASDIKREEDANGVMATYLKTMGMTMPSDDEIVAAREAYEVEQQAKAASRAGRKAAAEAAP